MKITLSMLAEAMGLVVATGGCGAARQPVQSPDRGYYEERVATAHAPGDPASDDRGSFVIAEDIRKACGIENPASYFAYDSSHLRGADHPLLGKLIDCFTSGPLKDRSLLLVGHCDARGEHEYNIVLGEHRAASVKRFLTARGLDGGRIATSSRGYMDATGTEETGWALDRRVDVRLAN
jgi:peptidoglycan-associated lipoprotein